ncbi:MAG: ATP-binding protein [Symploca sp. SIO1B1]|nr:ATP-binding protein [Symploca sp. SIO1B1]
MVQDLKLLKQIYNTFNPFQPLPAGDPVYVDCQEVRGSGDIIRWLGRDILFSHQNTYQLYAGHRGAGKSTELLRLKKYLEDNHCFVVYFAADEEDINPQDAQYTDILLACTRHLLEELKNADPKPLLNWLQQRWQNLKDLALTEISLENLSVEAQISEFGQLTANLRATPTLRQKIREQLNLHTTTLIDALNQFIAEATKQLPAGYDKLVVIADNLDRIVPVIQEDGKLNHEHIFLDRSKQLKALDCHLIYTVPISLLYSNRATDLLDIYGDAQILPMIMVRTPDEEVYELGLNKVKEVIAKRVSQVNPHLSLTTDIFDGQQTLEKLCLMSGGHVRNLLLMMQSALTLTDSLPISAKAVQQAVTKARNIYSNSVDDHQWIELAQVYRSKLTRNNDLHRSLLFNRCILEYRHSDDQGNIQLWRDVHPLLKSTKEFQAALKEL